MCIYVCILYIYILFYFYICVIKSLSYIVIISADMQVECAAPRKERLARREKIINNRINQRNENKNEMNKYVKAKA